MVLLDAHLEERDGRELAKLLRGNDEFQLTRVVAMSGKLSDTQLQSMKGNGFDSYLRKPFQVRQVVEAIEQVVSPVN